MTNVLGQINKLSHLAKYNKHYSLMNSHFSAESDSFCNTLFKAGMPSRSEGWGGLFKDDSTD